MTTPPGCPGPERPGAGRGTVAAIYNSAIAAWVIATAWEIGALDELRTSGTLDAAAIAYACREIDELCYAPTFWEAMERLDFADVELITCSMMGHDLWPRENCIDMTVGEVVFELG